MALLGKEIPAGVVHLDRLLQALDLAHVLRRNCTLRRLGESCSGHCILDTPECCQGQRVCNLQHGGRCKSTACNGATGLTVVDGHAQVSHALQDHQRSLMLAPIPNILPQRIRRSAFALLSTNSCKSGIRIHPTHLYRRPQ
ncbi:hypothetical protein SS50377_23935 [Spironucleus salmonicida]|uniref:Uncharacterized protein n=1 Tax=Spironucleus salmonicida TaxID=348837 RepID=A0A9P8RYJ4_9EUKA|nr:hypothetical protein SS50377_23927 [Spironucleus salmonicida]KAH0574000.1 hypothetical protein SS50377_23935 [Spironucleus salmonicida]